MGGTEPSPWLPHGAPTALLQPAAGDGQHHGMGQVPRVHGGSAAGGASITGTPPQRLSETQTLLGAEVLALGGETGEVLAAGG